MKITKELNREIINALPKSLIKHPNLFALKNSFKLGSLKETFASQLREEFLDWDTEKISRISLMMAWSAFLDHEFPGANTIDAFRH